ncbi:copper resistance protein NlpE [Psychroflexus planctonicus]|uniref:Copper resistance protein NlpE n=1 Tax=Psychroflexus planctonicus TaxID=1526575 RepID=A0ABQ1SF71_9FLAO|nr:copper resistance protein NlpE [Psychroflexus planctonicus]GGE33160.1 hypothetical protein GCM10010832_11740 [Psychroflexus planctonicus]
MLKKLLVFSLFIALISCQDDPKNKDNNSNEEQSKEFKDEHNARTALDYAGTYSGNLPCADCSFIRFKVAINKDQTFHAKYIYVDKSDEVFEDKGVYKWVENGNYIHLKASETKSEYKFKVEENSLLMLSQDGKEIDSAFKEKYYLKKS